MAGAMRTTATTTETMMMTRPTTAMAMATAMMAATVMMALVTALTMMPLTLMMTAAMVRAPRPIGKNNARAEEQNG